MKNSLLVFIAVVRHDVVSDLGSGQQALVAKPGTALGVVYREVALVGLRP